MPNWQPEVYSRGNVERIGQYPDDRKGLPVRLQKRADPIRLPSETLPPEAVAEQHYAGGFRLMLLPGEQTAEKRTCRMQCGQRSI